MARMHLTLLSCLLLCLPLCASAKKTAPSPQEPNAWQTLTLTDLEAMHQQIADNAVAPVSYQTKHFKAWFNPGFKKALKRAKTVNSFQGFYYTLLYYANGFKIPHFRVRSIFNLNTAQNIWPHFTLGYRDKEYRVIYSDTDDEANYFPLPPVGAKLISCDKESAETLYKKNVWPFMYSERKTEWSKIVHAPLLFLHDGNPWIKNKKQCTFEVEGKKVHYYLYWRRFQENETVFESLKNEATLNMEKQAFAIEPFNKTGIWIRIPDFEDTIWLRKIIKTMPTLRRKSLIVFDLRGNGGGKTNFGHYILQNLYGKNYLASLGDRFYLNREWIEEVRISPDNLQYLRRKSEGNYKNLIARMRHAAINKKDIMLDKKIPNEPTSTYSRSVKNPVKARVIVLTNQDCYSACWYFVRDVRAIPNTLHVGQPTGILDRYTSVRTVTLPSGIMKLVVPMKMLVTPIDHMGQPFIPQHLYNKPMQDEKALQQWLLRLVT